MIKTNESMGETPESSQGLGKFLGVGLVIFALWSFLTDKKPNKISIAGIKRRKSKRLFYMLDTGKGLTAVARQDVDNIKSSNPNRLHAVWALTVDDARALIRGGHGERYTGSTKKLDFAGHLLNCIGWQQVIDKNGKQITRCFIMAPNCKTKACIKETEERKAEGWKPKGRKAKTLQGVNLSCKQYVRDAYNKLRCKKFAITCNSENECGPKAPIPWKPVEVEYTPKAIRAVAKMLSNEMNQSIDDTKRVMRRIKYHGGIAPYAGGYLQEEYRDIPSKYKSKEGVKLDELAQEMEMDESALVEAINKAEEARSRLPRKKSRFSVKDMMFEAESYLAKQEGGLQGLAYTPVNESWYNLPSLKLKKQSNGKYKAFFIGTNNPYEIGNFVFGEEEFESPIQAKAVLKAYVLKSLQKGGQMTLFGKFKKLTHTERMEHIKINKTNRANSKFNHLVDTAATKLRNEDINRHVGVDVAWDAYRDYYIKDLRQYVLDLLVEGKAHLNIPAMAISRYRNTNPIEHVKETRTIIEMAMDHPQLLEDYLKPSEKRVSKPEPTEAKQERFKEEIIKRLTVPVTRTKEEKLEIHRSLTKSRGALMPKQDEPYQKKAEHKIAEKGGQMTLFGKLSTKEKIISQINRLETENKKLKHTLLLPKSYSDVVEGNFNSKALNKAFANTDKIIELKERLGSEQISPMTLFGKLIAKKIALRRTA